MKTYKSMPRCSVRAIQFNGDNFLQIKEHLRDEVRQPMDIKPILIVKTGYGRDSGESLVQSGDWIVWNQNNSFEVLDDFSFRVEFDVDRDGKTHL